MVAAARKEREAAERRNEALRAQLNDTELLLASHQEQLTELKTVMQQMSLDRDDHESNANVSTAPSTPAMPHHDHFSKIFEAFNVSANTPGHDDISPAPPTSFTYLLHPVLRTDLQSYDDFHALLQIPRNSTPPSRATSGTYSGLNALGIGNVMNREPTQLSGHLPSNGSTSSLSTPGTYPAPATPNNQSPNTSVASRDPPTSTVPLKETRFYKRALVEDLEPTLRLDTAPGLSWLVRRSVINSMCEGGLVVEPMPAVAKRYNYPCSLCGEHRKDEAYSRTHRFRTSESETAQRYPLCNYCLNRVRACCEFLGFLRMLKDGHWRTDGVEGEKVAWEESVRLREGMFWARVGGGVVPAFLHAPKSPRSSVEGAKPENGPEGSKVSTDGAATQTQRLSEDPFHSDAKRVSIGNTVISHAEDVQDVDDNWETAKNAPIFDDATPSKANPDDEPSKQLRDNLRDSLKVGTAENPRPETTSEGQQSAASPQDPEQRLSITIPGAFEF